jgi:hypothetical protein
LQQFSWLDDSSERNKKKRAKKISKAEIENNKRSKCHSESREAQSHIIDLADNSDCSDAKTAGGKKDKKLLKKKEQGGKVPVVADGKGVKKSSKASTFFLSKVVKNTPSNAPSVIAPYTIVYRLW